MNTSTSRFSGQVIAGVLLIALGALFLFGQWFHFSPWTLLWPFFIIGFGGCLFLLMTMTGKQGAGLAIPASLFTATGMLFLLLNTFHLWGAMAYAWALLFPTSIGIGIWITGAYGGQPNTQHTGRQMTIAGLVITGVMFVLTQMHHFGTWFIPVLLIGLGIFLLFPRGRFTPKPAGQPQALPPYPIEPPLPPEDLR